MSTLVHLTFIQFRYHEGTASHAGMQTSFNASSSQQSGQNLPAYQVAITSQEMA
ncbi:hypothetical protein [Brevibacillus agri]|uniref:hypothetical protein n=1 Tax=Brevibacillus agri TaxID=51101 RepID=UPI002867D20B|nr:hypothetical protein [Brevibacillus agri]